MIAPEFHMGDLRSHEAKREQRHDPVKKLHLPYIYHSLVYKEKEPTHIYRVLLRDRHKRKRHSSASRNGKTNLKKVP